MIHDKDLPTLCPL